ncbi:MAG: murein biosynthesis integral membrane protein MurJ [Myxococcota bacterium]|nr:murein biosynthesis integral membrane protein MurJ [Myxococcota bacterium]
MSNPIPKGRSGLLKAAMSMSVITLLSRVLGLVREQVRAHYLGTSMASDAFGIAFQIPNLLRRLVGEGAMSAGFIPVLSQYKEQEGETQAFTFARQFFNLSLILLVVISTLGVVGAGSIVAGFSWLSGQEISPEATDLTTSLTRWMFPYIAFVSWAALAQGILNTYRIFWVSAFTAVLLNIAIITSAIAFAQVLEEPAYGFGFGVLIGGCLQLFFQLPYVFRLGFRWKPDFRIGPGVKKALMLLVPTVFGAGVYQINVLVSQAIAWGLGNGAVSSLQYSSRLLELTLGVFAIALSTAILPSLAGDVANKETENVRQTLLYGIRLTCLVCFPVTAGLFLVRSETVSLLFERGSFSLDSTAMTAYALAFHIIGLTFIALSRVVLQVFYAFQDTWRPFWVALISMVVNLSLCYALAPHLSHGGIALANSASAAVQILLLGLLLKNHVSLKIDRLTLHSIGLSLITTALMAASVYGLQRYFQSEQLHGFKALALPYTVIVTTGISVFVASCLLLKHPEIIELGQLVKRRLRR